MKQWIRPLIKHALIPVFLLTAYILVNNQLRLKQQKTNLTHVLSFTLPFPGEIIKKFTFTKTAKINAVYISGKFSQWQPSNPHFRMIKSIEKKHSWSISLRFQSGTIPYKFVVFFKGRKKPIWIHDQFNSSKTADGFGGYNSILKITDYAAARELLRFLVTGLLSLYLLYWFFETIWRIVSKKRMRIKYRLVILFTLILFFSNIVLVWYNLNKQRTLVRMGYMEKLNLIHHFMLSEGIDYSKIHQPVIQERMKRSLQKFFWNIRTANETINYTSVYSTINRIVLFDKNGAVIAVGDRKELPLNLSGKKRKKYISRVYGKLIFGLLLKKAMTKPVVSKALFGSISKKAIGKLPDDFAWHSKLLDYNLLLSPILQNHQITGYYGIMIFPRLYGSQIGDSLLFQIIWGIIIILFAVFYFFFRLRPPAIDEKRLDLFYKRFNITKREQEIIGILIKGRSYQYIADKLYISLKTVKAHTYNIYQKAQVKNRVALINEIKEMS